MPFAPPHLDEKTKGQPVALSPHRLPRFERFAPTRLVGRMSPDEYIAWERRGEIRLEYVEGEVVEVPGGSSEHSRIAMNTMSVVATLLREAGADCNAHGSDQKIAVGDRSYRYPDGMVVCGGEQIDPRDGMQNPTMILEVLSASTEREDRTDKFRDYQRIPSLRHYVLIDQERPYVTHFEKLAQGIWAIVGQHTELTESLTLTLGNHEISIPLATIYHRIEFADQTGAGADVATIQEETTE